MLHSSTPENHDSATLNPGSFQTQIQLHLCPECRELLRAVVGAGEPSGIVDETPRAGSPISATEPDWRAAMAWLDAQCGGRDAVLRLNLTPLSGGVRPPEHLDSDLFGLWRTSAQLVEAAGRRFFCSELIESGLRALSVVVAHRPGLLVKQSPQAIAHGVIWAVARANGALYPVGVVTDQSLRDFLRTNRPGAVLGKRVQIAVRGSDFFGQPRLPQWRWPVEHEPLDPLGHSGLLIASVRRRLLAVRERALTEAALVLAENSDQHQRSHVSSESDPAELGSVEGWE